MSRLAVSTNIALALFLITISTGIYATEIARYDDGPFAGMGYPYSESARAGSLLFLAGQIGGDADGKLVPGGIRAEAEQMLLNIEAALARHGLTSWPKD